MNTIASRYTPANFCALLSAYWALRVQLREVLPIKFESIEDEDDYNYPEGLVVFSSVPNWYDYLDGLACSIPGESVLTIARLSIDVPGRPRLRVGILNTEAQALEHNTLLEAGKWAEKCRLLINGQFRSWNEIDLAPYMRWLEEKVRGLNAYRDEVMNDPRVLAKANAIRDFCQKVYLLVNARRRAGVEWTSFTEDCAYESGIYAGDDGLFVVAEAPSNFHDAASHEEPLMVTVKWYDDWQGPSELLMAGRQIKPPVLWLGDKAITWQACDSMEPWFAWLDEQIAQWQSLLISNVTESSTQAEPDVNPDARPARAISEDLRALADQLDAHGPLERVAENMIRSVVRYSLVLINQKKK